ncbi:ABC transporter permease/M1 family aminopeptidase [Qipengyuania spongiae]|uniref:Aminopeptidase n=1 Tax=Qipengyuania spongiae TaxID=2909673 RepID=A0ABY5T1B8_9SPHN|nr:M1 family aminopeptidase [Qipengyuania spongiae]UVI40375.1 aminopeptidase [Qipengyuania spongiae]
MFAKIAAFEARYQFRNPVFWVAVVLFFLLTFGATASENIQIGSGGNIHVNAPFAIVQIHLIMTLFYMFVATAFVANVVVRDEESGFGPMVRSTRVGKFDYLLGRFSGAFLAAALAFLAVPLAIWLGSSMPWVDPETLGPNRIEWYARAYLLFALPNVFVTSALFFAVATMTRSMMYTYVALVVFLVAYLVLVAIGQSQPEWRDVVAYAEPFGIASYGLETRYWTAAEMNSRIPAFVGQIAGQRVLWIGIGVLALATAILRFRFGEKGLSARKAKRKARKDAKLAAGTPQLVDRLPDLRPESAGRARMVARTRFEIGQVLRSPAFFILLAIGLFNTFGALYFDNEIYGTPARPITFSLIAPLMGSFALIPIIIAIYYGGELVWRDRERKIHEIIDATSVPGWSYMVPKTVAVAIVLFATVLISAVGAMLIQLARGVTPELGKIVLWYLLPMSVDMVILAILAVFVQALSPNKYVGWAIMVIYVVAQLVLSTMGFEHPLYMYGDTGIVPVSDINGVAVGGATAWWLRLYWGAVALMLAVLAHLLWRRGADAALKPRLKRLPRELASPSGALLGAGALVALATGGFLYNQMNVVEEYRTEDDMEARQAAYEKKYLGYEDLAQPAETKVTLDVALFPAETRMEASGQVDFVNDTGEPIRQLHLRLPDPNTEIRRIDVAGARPTMVDEDFNYRIYTFDEPLAPGASGRFSFTTRRWQRGLRASGDDTRLVANGTFLDNSEFMPQIGMNRAGLLQDRATRRKYGLEPELRPAKLEDAEARNSNYVGADWVTADITVTTDAGQTPVAPGVRVTDDTVDGRRTARFVSDSPILSFFSIQSADYALAEREADGVDLQVFYHPGHEFNVERMLTAMERALGYYRANFGPYQFPHARIIEFPGYATFAQAFAGTMPYSEGIGFIADNGDADDIDYVTYVTAHEVAHQYWAHQLISGDQQGGTLMVETLAQYSALMVMKELYGEDKIRRFLKFELDNYLSARGGEIIEELPLERVENQPYIHYRKGAVVMYLLQDRLGEDRVNAMLAGLLDRYRFQGPPYAGSPDLVQGFLGLARNESERDLVRDLLQRITLYDLKADEAKVRRLPDGRYETTLIVEAKKAYADGQGKERTAPLRESIDVGLFTERPGDGAFDRSKVLYLKRRPIASGRQEIRIITRERPIHAGIDPYNTFIDRNSDDNLVETT